uniref:Uncharacterized protein n=1 Tax=Arabidopsis thaliana TaxID=3702 RepID=Q0WL03_ARATH|nr:hypothetical protein [Arabidopsis thaliana]
MHILTSSASGSSRSEEETSPLLSCDPLPSPVLLSSSSSSELTSAKFNNSRALWQSLSKACKVFRLTRILSLSIRFPLRSLLLSMVLGITQSSERIQSKLLRHRIL